MDDFKIKHCPITEMKVIKTNKSSDPCQNLTLTKMDEQCVKFNEALAILYSKHPVNLPLSKFRVEEKWPCSKETSVSSGVDSTVARSDNYQLNEFHTLNEGRLIEGYRKDVLATPVPNLRYSCPYDPVTQTFFDERSSNLMDESAKNYFNLYDVQVENGVTEVLSNPGILNLQYTRSKYIYYNNIPESKKVNNLMFFARSPSPPTCNTDEVL